MFGETSKRIQYIFQPKKLNRCFFTSKDGVKYQFRATYICKQKVAEDLIWVRIGNQPFHERFVDSVTASLNQQNIHTT